MWDSLKRLRFEELRDPSRPLDAVEQIELAAMVRELEDAEAVRLKPAAARLRGDNDLLANRNLALAEKNRRRASLVKRLENVLAEALAEELAIETELAAVGVACLESNSDE